ncbi:MAG: ParB N-terminal domain-containing protein [Rubrobacteraceae bacterium]|nr:ParB N-terminal domain-containing protein [Rubrobacteraceae bacterium]
MIPVLDDLRLVSVGRLVLHEAHDVGRLAALKERMLTEGVQRNPIIVSPFGGDYLVLDGAHRLRALSELGCTMVLVQLAELPARVESWSHLVDERMVRRALEEMDGVEVGRGERWLLSVVFSSGEEVFVKPARPGIPAEIDLLWALQRGYPKGAPVRRVESGVPLDPPSGEALVRYRRFTPEELHQVVRLGKVLPAGITRFRIRERVLGVCFPLEKMYSGDEAGRSAELKSFVRRMWEGGKVRRYEEPVVLFE